LEKYQNNFIFLLFNKSPQHRIILSDTDEITFQMQRDFTKHQTYVQQLISHQKGLKVVNEDKPTTRVNEIFSTGL